ncbi:MULTISPECIES: hypothetical protein [Weissella]|nr:MULTISPECIES: hypothetical protein [Weissella]MBJ7620273.1 hypothetical protein [Weissella confusa]MBJ7683087.1 hypothetical protein [Weissella confusa]MBJ7685274.1 hypothetical protein [Weissella confusa]MBJ7702564.1 hypothetical protein [Weissella confusa]MCT8398530.1 hypothetical protein [Weissella cibaria]
MYNTEKETVDLKNVPLFLILLYVYVAGALQPVVHSNGMVILIHTLPLMLGIIGMLLMLLSSNLTYRRVFLLIVFVFLEIVFTIKNQLYDASLFSLAIFTMNMNLKDFLKVFFAAQVISFIIIASLSVVNVISITNPNTGGYTFGYANENTTGFLLAMMVVIFIYLSTDLRFIHYLSFLFVLVAEHFLFNDDTAFVALSLFFIGQTSGVQKLLMSRSKIRYLIVLLPLMLFYLARWLGFNYGRYDFIYRLDSLITGRPVIWNYYLTNYKPSLFGQELGISMLVNNKIVSSGAFDGSYIYYLFNRGTFMFSIMLLVIVYALAFFIRMRQSETVMMLLFFIVIGFTENISFSAIQSPMLVVAIGTLAQSWTKQLELR